jgi:hypothetical protein
MIIYYLLYLFRDRHGVFAERTIDLGKPGGVRKLEWGGNGEGEISLQATWGQGGWDRTTQEEGFQVSRRDSRKGGNWQKEAARGIIGNCAIT